MNYAAGNTPSEKSDVRAAGELALLQRRQVPNGIQTGSSEAVWLNRFPDYRKLLENAVRWRCEPQVSFEPTGGSTIPDTIEVSWRRAAGGELLLHLLNHTGAMSRPIEQLLPVYNLRILLHADAVPKGNLRAQALVSDANLKIERQRNVPVVLLPRLDAYEAIILPSA